MNKYLITYDGKKIVRWGNNSVDAVERLCDQYGWRAKLNLCDAETRGEMWCECHIDKSGGINYDVRILATSYQGKLN